MKSQIMSMFLALSAVATLGTTLQAQTRALKVDVPFAFHVGDKTYDAGAYTFRETGMLQIPTLQSAATAETTFISGTTASLTGKPEHKLVFRCYQGGNYYLAEIWSGQATGVAVVQSKAEKQSFGHEGEVSMITVAARVAD